MRYYTASASFWLSFAACNASPISFVPNALARLWVFPCDSPTSLPVLRSRTASLNASNLSLPSAPRNARSSRIASARSSAAEGWRVEPDFPLGCTLRVQVRESCRLSDQDRAAHKIFPHERATIFPQPGLPQHCRMNSARLPPLIGTWRIRKFGVLSPPAFPGAAIAV